MVERLAERKVEVIWEPQPKQAAFICCPCDDIAFGGARGGGKSDSIPADFASHEDVYGKDAIGLAVRRERTQLTELIERAKQILQPIGFKWHEQDKFFTGVKGGRLRFSYLENDSDADQFQGHSYTRLYPEEMGTFPMEQPIQKLYGTLRSGAGVPCQMKGTCNPGGPGHQWVKARYRIGEFPKGYEIFKFSFINPFTKSKIEKTRVFIPSLVSDNKYLGDDYVANLYQVGSEQLVRAWLYGDWEVIQGAFFPEWSARQHVIEPFKIPEMWLRFRAADWGSAKPFCIQWWCVVGDDHKLLSGRILPRGMIVCYREWYGSTGVPNEGLKMPAEDVADGIVSRETDEPRTLEGKAAIAYGVIDPAAYISDGGPSIAERMAKRGVLFRRADNARVASRGAMGGWDQMRARLRGDGETPMMAVFSTCVNFIRTFPALQHDRNKTEDVDTESEDHSPDTGRYACMSRPYVKQIDKQPETKILSVGPLNQVTLEDMWDQQPTRRRQRV